MSPTGTPKKSAINECILKTVLLRGNNDGWMGWQKVDSGTRGKNTSEYPNFDPSFSWLSEKPLCPHPKPSN